MENTETIIERLRAERKKLEDQRVQFIADMNRQLGALDGAVLGIELAIKMFQEPEAQPSEAPPSS